MSLTARIIIAVLMLLTLAGGTAWCLHLRFKSDAGGAGALLLKWALTGVLLFLAIVAIPWFAYVGPFVIVACGVVFALLWAPAFGALAASPITSAIDGGTAPPELQPQLSQVEALRKRGNYHQAIARLNELHAQFPRDFELQMLLASIHAENLRDLDRAGTAVERILNQPGHPRNHHAFALTQLADWHLGHGGDVEAARHCFERIQEMFPGTEQANVAAQRLAHLPAVGEEPPAAPGPALTVPTTMSAEARAELLTRHLARHPLDADAREELVSVLASELGQTTPAIAQLETLIAQPNHAPRKTARWLNRIADIHAQQTGDGASAAAALRRIEELFPGTQFAATAVTRRERLPWELRGKQTSQALKLGSYENDLGLKPGPTSG